MSDPFISIIIPTFNEEQKIGKLLNYLKKCCSEITYEIIIADGGSSDATISIAETSGARVLHCSKKGRAPQMNAGAKHANASLLYFLHADSFPPLNFIDEIRYALAQGYQTGGFQLVFDDPHPILKFYSWCTQFQLTIFRFGDQSLFVQKDVFQGVGGFDESLTVMEDQKIVRKLKKISPFYLSDERVKTSARRYKTNGIIRLQAVFSLIVIMYYAGADQQTLVHVYNRFINSKK